MQMKSNLLCALRNKASFYYARKLGETRSKTELETHEAEVRRYAPSIPKDLRVTSGERINDRDDVRALRDTLLLLLRNKRPKFVDVDRPAVLQVLRLVEVPHADLPEVTIMVLIEVSSISKERMQMIMPVKTRVE